jgi:hypothetical protein
MVMVVRKESKKVGEWMDGWVSGWLWVGACGWVRGHT